MKKICLLAIASFFSALAFSQNAATTKTVPGQPKAGRSTTTNASATPAFTTVNGTGVSKFRPHPVTTKAVTTKQNVVKPVATVPADKAAN